MMRHQTNETRAKISAAMMGRPKSAEHRAKLSAVLMGNTRRLGSHASGEARAKLSAAGIVRASPEWRAMISKRNWKGGSAVWERRHRAKRRLLGCVALNEWFVGCVGHHVDNELVIYIPEKLHRSIYHRQSDGRGMAKMNAIAYNFLFKQEVEALIPRVTP